MVYTWTMSFCIVELRIGLIALILPFICLFFLSFKAKFVSRFSLELFKLKSSIMVCLCKMRDHIIGLRNKLIALFLVFLSNFLYFQFHMLTLKICTSFLGKY